MAYAFSGGRVFIGDGRVIESGCVTVENGRITRVGDASAPVDPSFEHIDLKGKTLLPGFIDCHVHLVMDGSGDPIRKVVQDNPYQTAFRAARLAEQTLRIGFTTVRGYGRHGRHRSGPARRDSPGRPEGPPDFGQRQPGGDQRRPWLAHRPGGRRAR